MPGGGSNLHPSAPKKPPILFRAQGLNLSHSWDRHGRCSSAGSFKPTAPGWGSNLGFHSDLSWCSQILNPLCHSGNSEAKLFEREEKTSLDILGLGSMSDSQVEPSQRCHLLCHPPIYHTCMADSANHGSLTETYLMSRIHLFLLRDEMPPCLRILLLPEAWREDGTMEKLLQHHRHWVSWITSCAAEALLSWSLGRCSPAELPSALRTLSITCFPGITCAACIYTIKTSPAELAVHSQSWRWLPRPATMRTRLAPSKLPLSSKDLNRMPPSYHNKMALHKYCLLAKLRICLALKLFAKCFLSRPTYILLSLEPHSVS